MNDELCECGDAAIKDESVEQLYGHYCARCWKWRTPRNMDIYIGRHRAIRPSRPHPNMLQLESTPS